VLLDDPVIRSIAEARGRTPAQVLIAWQVRNGVSAIPKSVTPSRLPDNLAAGDLALTEAELQQIASLDRGYRMIAGDFWVVQGTPWTRQTIWDEA
jgi:alcohol dehydrogenase (NADP+)